MQAIVHDRKNYAKSLYPCGKVAVLSNESALEYWRLHKTQRDGSLVLRTHEPRHINRQVCDFAVLAHIVLA